MMMTAAALVAAALVVVPAASARPSAARDAVEARVARILARTPLIDGHNDWPWALREHHASNVEGVDLARATDTLPQPMMTDIARLHAGHVGAQFWSVYIPAEITGAEAVRTTIDQIDIVHRLVARFPRDLEMAGSAADIVRSHRAGRIASLIGIEGGHQIGGDLAVLRQFYALGARYLTLTHTRTNDFADSATDAPKWGGLNGFGRAVVAELNRLGMLVDLSHVSPATMRAAIAATKAPVIFSHSNAAALDPHARNVPDDVLRLLPANGGVVMVTFVPGFASDKLRLWNAARAGEEARVKALYPAGGEAVPRALAAWDAANAMPVVGVGDVADMIEHIVKVAGHDHVGIGGDLDGVTQTIPGLSDVASYPRLFAELIARGWRDADLAKLAGGNMLRVMAQAERVAAAMKDVPPSRAAP